MKEVIKFLQENSAGFLATVSGGKPKVRPFQFMLEEGGKLFFCTANTKDVFKQLKANPYVEFSSMTPSFAWIRLSGEVKFTGDKGVKEQILAANPLVKSIYQSADNPVFEIFYLDHGVAILADFSGQAARTITF